MNQSVALSRVEIWHRSYNIFKKDNLATLPLECAIFGIFAVVAGELVNCRYVGETENLKGTVISLFDTPGSVGLQKFMHGPWIKMLQFELMPGSSADERRRMSEEWTRHYLPAIDEEGEYPGYYDFQHKARH